MNKTRKVGLRKRRKQQAKIKAKQRAEREAAQ